MKVFFRLVPFSLPGVLTVSALAVAAGSAAAGPRSFPVDSILVQKITSSQPDAGEGRRELLMSGDRLKVREQKKGVVTETLVDFGAERVWMWRSDSKNRTFVEASFADLSDRFQRSFEGFRKLPAADQQRLRAQADALPPTRVVATDEFATIAGLKARKYEVTIVEQKQELWASPDFRMPAKFDELNELTNPLMGPRGRAVRDRMHQLHQQIDGFILKEVKHLGLTDKPYVETVETIELRKGAKIPASELETPKGWTKAAPLAATSASAPAPFLARPASLSMPIGRSR